LLATDQPAERQPTRVNLLRRLSNLAAAVPKDGLLLLSFSGHGMERGGQAFLLPSDAQISDQISFLEDTAVNVTRMRDLIRATGVAQVMILLDACRNDPDELTLQTHLVKPTSTASTSTYATAKFKRLRQSTPPPSGNEPTNTLRRNRVTSRGPSSRHLKEAQ
jgi:hypothetical protein